MVYGLAMPALPDIGHSSQDKVVDTCLKELKLTIEQVDVIMELFKTGLEDTLVHTDPKSPSTTLQQLSLVVLLDRRRRWKTTLTQKTKRRSN
eukprot:SAG11_NODE_714_length_7634_cov_4.848706_5_plen_92_part_00